MTTPFGKYLKYISVEQDISLATIAGMLDISQTYLSFIINGQRPIPEGLLEKLIKEFKLSDEEAYKARVAKLKTDGNFEITLGKNKEKQVYLDTAVALQELYPNLSEKQCQEILDLIKGFSKKKWPWQK